MSGLQNVWGVVIDAPKYHLLLSVCDEDPKELKKREVSHTEFFVYYLPAAQGNNIRKTTKTQMGQYVMFRHCYTQLGLEGELEGVKGGSRYATLAEKK